MTISQERMMIQPNGVLAIPIKVYVPRDCTPTTPGASSDRMEWELSAKADVAGIDFAANFIIRFVELFDLIRVVPGCLHG